MKCLSYRRSTLNATLLPANVQTLDPTIPKGYSRVEDGKGGTRDLALEENCRTPAEELGDTGRCKLINHIFLV